MKRYLTYIPGVVEVRLGVFVFPVQRDKMTLEEVNQKLGPIFFMPYLEPFNGEEATEQGKDVFESYFKYLVAQGDPLVSMEAKKEVLIGSLHDVYRRDLEESFQLVVGQLGKGGAVAMETCTSSTSHSPGAQ